MEAAKTSEPAPALQGSRRGGLARLLVGFAIYSSAFLTFMATVPPPPARPRFMPFLPLIALLSLGITASGTHRLLWKGLPARDRLRGVGRALLSLSVTLVGIGLAGVLIGLGVQALHGFVHAAGAAPH